MSLKRLSRILFVFILMPFSAAVAQTTPPAAPVVPETPEAPSDFTFLISGGSFLGIYPEEVTNENMGRFNLRNARGVAISKVVEGSPADKAGLKKDDVVLRFKGEEVTSVRKLIRLISEVAPDHFAQLTISRNGAEQQVSVTLGTHKGFGPQVDIAEGDMSIWLEELKRAPGGSGNPGAYTFALGSRRRIGVSTNTLTKQLADFFGVDGGKGVLITSVREGSPAAKAGLIAGDVITEIDGEKVDESGDLSRAINRKNDGDVTLTIVRDKSQRMIHVTPEKGEAMPLLGPDYRFETLPRIGELQNLSNQIAPRIKTIVMPRIEITPRIKELIRTRPL